VITPCPTDPVLRCYSRGELDYAEATRLDEHLVACEECLARLEQLDHPPATSDPNPSSPAAPDHPPALERAIAAVLTGSGYDALPTLPGYQLLGRIGQGGMGTVCKAIHLRLAKTVAVKVLRWSRKNDPESIARFEREMRAVGRLDHPNIVRASDAGVADGVHFLVMEFVDGVDLSRLVRKAGPLPLTEACRYVIQAAAGLEAAHRHGMIHRDVKPSNLIRAADGTVKVLDLGLASLPFDSATDSSTDPATPHEPLPDLTGTGHALGTRDYMPPEQKLAPNAVGPTADVYGLGATLCHLLTGHPPRPGTPLPVGLPDAVWAKLLHADPAQ
jgi:serine/threonine protein kinase